MHRRQPYRPVNPLTGIWAPRGNALYRYASPDGDGRSCEISTTHPLARHSATHAVTCGHDLPQLCGGNSSDHYSLIPAHSSFTFSAKEKDSETGLSYFGSRYYSSDLSIWLSVDPMADKYPSMSPYVYCANNPVKLVDPNGEEVGNYYDLNGNYLGNDKIDDGKIYVVIETPTGNTSVNPRDQYDEKNIFQVPSFEKRKEIVDKLEDFDRQRPNAEWGGVCGVGINPNNDMYEVEKVVWGNPSQDGNPSNSERLGYRQLNMKEIGINGFCVFFDYHSHGSGGWIQKPSNWFDSEAGIWRGDIPNVTKRLQVSSGSRTFAVFAMEEKNVYFYTDKGVCGKMDFNTFRNLGQ